MNSSLVWFGFLPVLAFMLMSSFGGKRRALWGALFMGGLEAGYSIAATGGLDYMSLLAFAVLGVFVAASLRKDDDFFFKISGAVINAIQAVVMLVAFYAFHRALLLDAANKYLDLDKLVAANPRISMEILTETFRVLSFQLPAWLILHALLTVYAAANWSKWTWAFVNLPGLLIVLMLAFAFAEVGVLKGSPQGLAPPAEKTDEANKPQPPPHPPKQPIPPIPPKTGAESSTGPLPAPPAKSAAEQAPAFKGP